MVKPCYCVIKETDQLKFVVFVGSHIKWAHCKKVLLYLMKIISAFIHYQYWLYDMKFLCYPTIFERQEYFLISKANCCWKKWELLLFTPFYPFFLITRLRSRRVVMCLVVVYGSSFVPSLIQLRVFNIF